MDGIVKRGYQATASQPPNQQHCWFQIQTQISSQSLSSLHVTQCAKPILSEIFDMS